MKLKENFALIAIMIFVAAMTRLIPHYPNFTAVGAIALFGGAYLSRKWALLIPIVALFVSDLFLNNLIYAQQFPENYQGFVWFNTGSLSVYLAFILVVIIGMTIVREKSILSIAGSSLLASVLFFLITNFAIWIGSVYYPQTFAGLILCYEAGLPFFVNTIAGDLFFVTILFGGYAVVEKWLASRQLQEQTE